MQVMYVYILFRSDSNETHSHRKEVPFCILSAKPHLKSKGPISGKCLHYHHLHRPYHHHHHHVVYSTILSAKASIPSPKADGNCLYYHHGRSHVRKGGGSTTLNPNRRGPPSTFCQQKPHLKPKGRRKLLTLIEIIIIIIMLPRSWRCIYVCMYVRRRE